MRGSRLRKINAKTYYWPRKEERRRGKREDESRVGTPSDPFETATTVSVVSDAISARCHTDATASASCLEGGRRRGEGSVETRERAVSQLQGGGKDKGRRASEQHRLTRGALEVKGGSWSDDATRGSWKRGGKKTTRNYALSKRRAISGRDKGLKLNARQLELLISRVALLPVNQAPSF